MRALQVTLSVLLLATLVTASTHFQVIGANADTVFLQDKAISFVKNVLPFNISHYSIGVSESYFLSDPNDTTTTQVVIVDLNSTDSMIRLLCLFENASLYQCAVNPTGIPVSDKSYNNLEDAAKRILQAYQDETGLDSTLLLKTLNIITNSEPVNVTIGEVSHSAVDGVALSVTRFPDIIGSKTVDGIPVPIPSNSSYSTTFKWLFSNASVILMFDKGVFADLQDDREPVSKTSSVGSLSSQSPGPQISELSSRLSAMVPEILVLIILLPVISALMLVLFLEHRKKLET